MKPDHLLARLRVPTPNPEIKERILQSAYSSAGQTLLPWRIRAWRWLKPEIAWLATIALLVIAHAVISGNRSTQRTVTMAESRVSERDEMREMGLAAVDLDRVQWDAPPPQTSTAIREMIETL